MNSSKKEPITAFHGVFENKLAQLIKKIRKMRKDPKERHRVKELLSEAKKLKKLIKKDRKKQTIHTIEIPLTVYGEGALPCVSDASSKHPVKILDSRLVGGLVLVDFEVLTAPVKEQNAEQH